MFSPVVSYFTYNVISQMSANAVFPKERLKQRIGTIAAKANSVVVRSNNDEEADDAHYDDEDPEKEGSDADEKEGSDALD